MFARPAKPAAPRQPLAPARRGRFGLRPLVEGLERRELLASYTWIGPDTGGDYGVPSNWMVGDNTPADAPPREGDRVAINLPGAGVVTVSSTAAAQTLTTNRNVTFRVQNGTFSLGGMGFFGSSLGGPVTVEADARLNFVRSTGIAISGSTLTVASGGFLSLSNNISLLEVDSTPASIEVNGTLAVNGTSIQAPPSNTGYINVNPGGRIEATGARFDTTRISLAALSQGSITASSIRNTLAIDSETSVVVRQNDLSGLTNPMGLIASGNPDVDINLTGNLWDNTDENIRTIIHDKDDSTTLPQVRYDNTLVKRTTTAVTRGISSFNYSGSVRTFNVSATVSEAAVPGAEAGAVHGGTVRFAVLQGGVALATSQAINVTAGVASGLITLRGSVGVGTFTLRALFSGTDTLLASATSSQTFRINQAPTSVALRELAPVAYDGTADRTIDLFASVTSAVGGFVNNGSVTFVISKASGATIATRVAAVFNASASASFTLPAGSEATTYVVRARYAGAGGSFANSPEFSTVLVVYPIATTLDVTSGDLAAPFRTTDRTVSVAANVVSGEGPVTSGTVIFQLLDGETVVPRTTVQGTVGADGSATAQLKLPGGLSARSYIIRAIYGGNGGFAGAVNVERSLRIDRAATSTTTGATSVGYNDSDQRVALTATVADPAEPGAGVNGGVVTFRILGPGSTLIAQATSGAVAGGVASASLNLPGGLALGDGYSVLADYSGSGSNYNDSSAPAAGFTVNPAGTVVAADPVAVEYSPASRTVTLSATVTTAGGGVVAGGRVRFTVLRNGTEEVGSPVEQAVTGGTARVDFALPAGTGAGAYALRAAYLGTANSGASHRDVDFTISKATPAIAWGNPADIDYGTALAGDQLNAAASAPGAPIRYTPGPGTILDAGAGQTLTATFTPADPANYNPATRSVAINVARARTAFAQIDPSRSLRAGEPTTLVRGVLAAPRAVPVGGLVAVSIGPGRGTGAVQADGTFAVTVATLGLAPGDYPIRYGYAGSANFEAAGDESTTLKVVRVEQAITLAGVPAAATYGDVFPVYAASSAGLPVSLAASNATVTRRADGGYDVRVDSGTGPVVLTAAQPGDAVHSAAPTRTASVATRKAEAPIALVIPAAREDGSPHPAIAATTPPGLAVAIRYSRDGAPVDVPVLAGTYQVSASIDDPNYQGATASTLTIEPRAVPAPPPPPAPVSAVSARVVLNKKKRVASIVIRFSGDLDAGSASAAANYRLATAGSKGSFDAKNARTIRIVGASYDAASRSVTLAVKPFAVTRPTQLRILGQGGRSVLDTLGRAIDGNRDGVIGGDQNGILRKKSLTL